MSATHLECCPFCSSSLSAEEAAWWVDALTVIGKGRAVRLSKKEAIVFDLLWKAAQRRAGVAVENIMEALYGDDPNGGPESDNAARVIVSQTRKSIQPTGMSIECSGGIYLLRIRFAEVIAA